MEGLPVQPDCRFFPTRVIYQIITQQAQLVAKFDIQQILGLGIGHASEIIKSVGNFSRSQAAFEQQIAISGIEHAVIARAEQLLCQRPDVVGVDGPGAGGGVKKNILGVMDIRQLVSNQAAAEVGVEFTLSSNSGIGRNLSDEALRPADRGR